MFIEILEDNRSITLTHNIIYKYIQNNSINTVEYLILCNILQDKTYELNTDNIEEYNILEFYYRVRLIIDYISGMTDDFALEEYKILHAIK